MICRVNQPVSDLIQRLDILAGPGRSDITDNFFDMIKPKNSNIWRFMTR